VTVLGLAAQGNQGLRCRSRIVAVRVRSHPPQTFDFPLATISRQRTNKIYGHRARNLYIGD
jgi:hypothetical protein